MNEIFEFITRAGLDPSLFIWEKVPSIKTSNLIVPSLIHVPNRYYFIFDMKEEKHFCEYSPGTDIQVARDFPGSWVHQKNNCIIWIDNIIREVEAPDLWGALTSPIELVSGIDTILSDNVPFNFSEKEKIKGNLIEIFEYIKSTGLANEQNIRIIEDRIGYLQEASERLGRKDWIGLAVGVIMNIVVAAAFSPERTQEVFRFAGRILSWLIHQPPAIP
jgi:hypothetical protein